MGIAPAVVMTLMAVVVVIIVIVMALFLMIVMTLIIVIVALVLMIVMTLIIVIVALVLMIVMTLIIVIVALLFVIVMTLIIMIVVALIIMIVMIVVGLVLMPMAIFVVALMIVVVVVGLFAMTVASLHREREHIHVGRELEHRRARFSNCLERVYEPLLESEAVGHHQRGAVHPGPVLQRRLIPVRITAHRDESFDLGQPPTGNIGNDIGPNAGRRQDGRNLGGDLDRGFRGCGGVGVCLVGSAGGGYEGNDGASRAHPHQSRTARAWKSWHD